MEGIYKTKYNNEEFELVIYFTEWNRIFQFYNPGLCRIHIIKDSLMIYEIDVHTDKLFTFSNSRVRPIKNKKEYLFFLKPYIKNEFTDWYREYRLNNLVTDEELYYI